jgi:serine/threonine protein kinase/tetratricopeptide (TPR) repeat protein
MTGKVVSHYRVLDKLGSGGMGEVFRAEDLRLKRQVALKFLPPGLSSDQAAVERFKREAEAASALNHPHICTLHDIDEHEGRRFLVLELLEGQALNEAIASGPLPARRVADLALQIADALDAAHAKGVVHRDLKPSNIWVTSRGDAKLLDFGVAKLIDSVDGVRRDASTRMLVTSSGDSIGTPDYMSPEQVRGEPADARTDLFALGLVMYEMATSRPAFSGPTVGVVLDAVLNRAPERPSHFTRGLPSSLEQIILRAIEKDAALRYQSARDLMADLRRLTRDLTPVASPATYGSSPVRDAHSRNRWWRWGAVAAVAATALIGAAWFLSRDVSTPAPLTSASRPGGPARLVVLPFENLTRQGPDDWLAGAFADALSAGLQPLEDIVLVPRERVVELYAAESRHESQSLSADLARQISQKLRVRYYVHGSYQRVGDDLRVVARLVDAQKDAIEAQETLTNRFANVFELEDELASRFATRLGARGSIAASPRESPPLEAYQAVIDARAHYALGRFLEARALLQRAVDQAPRYATAWAWLSKVDSRLASPSNFEGDRERTELLRQALTEATTAVTLQPGLVDSEMALALVYRGLQQTPALRAAVERAIALDPRNGEAHGLLAESYAMSASFGCPSDPRPELADERYRDALAIDPLNGAVRLSLTTHLWWMNRQAEAFAVVEEGLSIRPDTVMLNVWAPFNMSFAGRADEAFELLRKNTLGVSDLQRNAFIAAIIELKRRNFVSADDYFRKAGPQFAETLPFPLIAAVTHFQVGRMEEGAMYLQRGLQRQAACIAWFDHVPAFAPFKNEPAVRKVLARVQGR